MLYICLSRVPGTQIAGAIDFEFQLFSSFSLIVDALHTP